MAGIRNKPNDDDIIKFRNKYRIPSARAQWWDYSWSAQYFVTICTRQMIHFFGEVVNEEMKLTSIGELADNCWHKIPDHFPFAELAEFTVMPNHIHGIIIINQPPGKPAPPPVETRFIASPPPVRTAPPPGQTASPKQPEKPTGGITGIKNPMLHDSLSRVLRWYKGRIAYESRKLNDSFGWQSRFHDHIIRTPEEYHKIAVYILNNPVNWQQDKFYSL